MFQTEARPIERLRGLDTVSFAQLSGPRQALVRLCQSVNYGYIQDLHIRDSDPVFDPAPVVLLDVKLDSENGPRLESKLADFELRLEFCRLLAQLDEFKNAKIERIEVRAGIPRRVLFRLAEAIGADFRTDAPSTRLGPVILSDVTDR